MVRITRRTFNGVALTTGMTCALPTRSAPLTRALQKTGKYNYRLRFIRRNRKVSVWTYVTSSRNWDADVPFSLLVSSDASADQTSGPNANATYVVYSTNLLSDSELSHVNRHAFKLPETGPTTLFMRLVLGPEQAMSKVWRVRLPK